MRLKLASRKSDLARWQAVQVARCLEQHAEHPSIEFLFKASMGDLNLDTPLDAMGSKGVFTEDFYEDLKTGACDMVVHSWKDLPVEPRPHTHIAMTLPRADVRDVFLVPEEVWQQAVNSGVLRVLTSSPRRVYNLKSVLPAFLPAQVKVEFVPVRGNVPTRLTRMHQLKAGLILAKAGLDRLLSAEGEGFLNGEVQVRGVIRECRIMVLPVSVNPPAPAQGALAVEVAASNSKLLAMCGELNHAETFEAAERERAILHKYGGGCHQKIGVTAFTRDFGSVISLRGETDAGEILREWKIESPVPWMRARSAESVFPLGPDDNDWFERRALAVDHAGLARRPALMVSKSAAWPRGYLAPLDQLVWTAGVKSWKKLAELGVWVHGCSDGLGEDEGIGLDLLLGHRPEWSKLTHAGAARGGDIATYELKSHDRPPELSGKTHFYWLSGSSFERARQVYPDVIAEGYHACGPGATLRRLRSAGLRRPVKTFMDVEQFLAETLPG